MKRSLFLSTGALNAALMLSAPATAAEGRSARETRGGGDPLVQVGGHRGQARGPRGEFRGPRGYGRVHFRHGSRHWRRGSYWRGGPRHWRRYGHYPRYGSRYGYGYLGLSYLGSGYGINLMIPID